MKVRNMLKMLTKADIDKEILVSSDEELNCVFNDFQIAKLEGTDKLVLFPYSGSEIEI